MDAGFWWMHVAAGQSAHLGLLNRVSGVTISSALMDLSLSDNGPPVLTPHRNLNSFFKFQFPIIYLSIQLGLHTGGRMDKNHDWVISGMSGRFPKSENVDIFWEKLIEGKDLISENNTRWDAKAYQIPRRIGSIGSVDKFDASFFGVSNTQANTVEPKTSMQTICNN
ncbi:unnamed protein product [Allacma fusca]|uniref:Beta-ketoacyl synthase-like N-terminal domain-containing protein n=1 Tax=Allacma fusca TaxID=39272 RepID=A0A8J2LEV9_9HEXA|nr:unnamed protein product [Allacma fusca]